MIGLLTYWPVTLVMFALEALFGILWNVITVSLRQSIIPEHLLGRVNSVYRFFAWGMMPIGAAIGGVLVFVLEGVADRETALRATWIATSLRVRRPVHLRPHQAHDREDRSRPRRRR